MVINEKSLVNLVDVFLEQDAQRLSSELEKAELADLADFTHGLFFLQHAMYPHLRPMYRTVHRTVPRQITFRAIRWVNPARMYPVSQLSREEIAAMSKEERAEAITELAKYRREAHVIHNRYNEMIDLIHEGKLPYHINYAGVKVENLDQYLERAERLKAGVDEWEQELDREAVLFREEMNKQDEKFDDVDALWEDGIPPFFDPKRGKAKKAPMRKLDRDGNKIGEIKVNAREFLFVPAEEMREGEDFWLPKKIAFEGIKQGGRNMRIYEGIADYNMSGVQRFLDQDGQFMTELPGGRKVIINYEMGAGRDPVGRREGRYTQPDPLGRRGQARHAGGVPGAAGSHERAPELGGEELPHEEVPQPAMPPDVQRPQQPHLPGFDRRDPETVVGTEEMLDPDAGQATDKTINTDAVNKATIHDDAKINPRQHQDMLNSQREEFFDAAGITSPELYDSIDLSNIEAGDVKYIKQLKGGTGADKGDAHVVEITDKQGVKKQFVYKISRGENYGENAAYVMDRALGLGVQPAIHIGQLPLAAFKGAVPDKHLKRLKAFGETGGGMLMEYHGNIPRARLGAGVDWSNKENREHAYGMMLTDMILGNPDRHHQNWGSDSSGNLLMFDTGLAGRFNDIDFRDGPQRGQLRRGKGLVKWETWRDHDVYADPVLDTGMIGHNFIPDFSGVLAQISGDQANQEIQEYFDNHFDMQKVGEVAEVANLQVIGKFMNGDDVTTAEVRQRFVDRGMAAVEGTFSKKNHEGAVNRGKQRYTQSDRVNFDAPPPAEIGGEAPTPEPSVDPSVDPSVEPEGVQGKMEFNYDGVVSGLADEGAPKSMIDAAMSPSNMNLINEAILAGDNDVEKRENMLVAINEIALKGGEDQMDAAALWTHILENKPELVQISATPAANEISEPSAVQAPPAPPPPTPTPEPSPVPEPSKPDPSRDPSRPTPDPDIDLDRFREGAGEGARGYTQDEPVARPIGSEDEPSAGDLEEEVVDDVSIPESAPLPSEAQSLGLNREEWAAVQDARRQLRNISDPNQRSLAAEEAYEELQDEHGSLGNLNVSNLIQSSAAIKQIDRRKYI